MLCRTIWMEKTGCHRMEQEIYIRQHNHNISHSKSYPFIVIVSVLDALSISTLSVSFHCTHLKALYKKEENTFTFIAIFQWNVTSKLYIFMLVLGLDKINGC